jgi:D-alanyl-D-alanine carboxypeptidase
LPGGGFHAFLAKADTRFSFVDGDDLLAMTNRSPTGGLPPDYRPSDLVDLRDGVARSGAECDAGRICLRREAAGAMRLMLQRMRVDGVPGRVESGYRGFGLQCGVFAWSARRQAGGFCQVTTENALAGHSQHQLGTTVDMFTSDWATRDGRTGQGLFRDGFGCTAGGEWLQEHSWQFGFVIPYPIHPDDRSPGSRCAARPDDDVPINPKTGFKQEPWHLRYVGVSAAEQYHQAWLASGPGSANEIALEQWLRSRVGLPGDIDLPVCDGCNCGACATFAEDGDTVPCGDASLRLDESGRVASPAEPPRILDVRATMGIADLATIDVTVRAAAHTPTQPPVIGARGPVYIAGSSFESLIAARGRPAHRYDDLPGAWRIGIEPVLPGAIRWPWRASLAKPDLEHTWNRANALLPADAGDHTVRVRVTVPAGTEGLRVSLLEGGNEHGTVDVALAPRSEVER